MLPRGPDIRADQQVSPTGGEKTPMNWAVSIFIILMAFLTVFLEAYIEFFRDLLGAQLNLLPALMICASLTSSIWSSALLAICGGLWFDSLSCNPLGVSILPLFIVGFVIHQFRDLLLRQNAFAQFAMGLIASVVCPLLTIFFMFNIGCAPLVGWKSTWQFIVMAIGGGLMTPVCFRFLEWVDRSLNYRPANQMSFRPDREIKHGRTGRL